MFRPGMDRPKTNKKLGGASKEDYERILKGFESAASAKDFLLIVFCS
jgi:hypothetical protein